MVITDELLDSLSAQRDAENYASDETFVAVMRSSVAGPER